MNLFRIRKPDQLTHTHLKPTLTAIDLVLMGIGVIIGAGVFVVTGVAAATKGGPGITLSYAVAGIASLFAALSYAELATSIGGCGSAYGYTYAGFGEIVAWIVGWNLLFEYLLAVSAIAIGWSGYVNDALVALHIHLHPLLTKNPFEGGLINLPAVLIIGLLGFILCMGVRQSARFNFVMVCVKLATIGLFIFAGLRNLHAENWHNFLPFGWHGVMEGAALVFFSYIGFDALSTTAEETINPKRNLPIGIIGSLLACAVIYMVVSGILTAMVPYQSLNVTSPVSDALLLTGHPWLAGIIAAGAIAGLTTGMLVMYYGLTRITLAISRDGLLPPLFSRVNQKTHTPITNIVIYGIVMAAIAGLMPLGAAAELVNIGTLSAFVIVCAGVVVLRRLHPELPRPFHLPLGPVIPLLGIASCLFLMFNLPLPTWLRFFGWMIAGVLIYFGYGYRHSLLGRAISPGSDRP